MRLVFKLALALVGGMFLLFAAYASLSIGHLGALFEADMRRDQHTLARALEPAVASLWKFKGREEALELVALANETEAKTQIRWLWLEKGGEHVPPIPPALLADLRDGREEVDVDRDRFGRGRISTFRPVLVNGEVVGAIELSEGLDEEWQFIVSRIWRTLTTGLLMIGVGGGLATVLGVHLVGRPIGQLIDKARRVGAGDFGAPLVVRRNDEIADLAVEMNLMTQRLAEMTARVGAEVEARLHAMEQLRHVERLSTVGTLASGIAHELGTPLNVVSGRAKMIQEEAGTPEEVRHHAKIVVDQVVRMTRIIRQLLDFARQRSPQKGPVEASALVRQTLDLLRPLARKQGVDLACTNGADEAWAEVDANQIQQALTNLVMNAIQASPNDATVTTRVSTQRAVPPDAGTYEPHAYVRIAVEDQGCGIAPETLPRIFEPFFTTKAVGEGTGLGLSVAYGIVRENGGWIDVDSARGRGSRFSIYLPWRGTDES